MKSKISLSPLFPGLSTCLALLTGLVCSAVRAADSGTEVPALREWTAWRKPTGDWLKAQAVSLNATDPTKFVIQPGDEIWVNGPAGRTSDLIIQGEFGDAQVHVEFCITQHSNSGVYLMGRYEVQIYDSHGVAKDKYPGIECGGIYPRWTAARNEFEGHSPVKNVSKPAGEWQSFDITFRAPRFDASGKKVADAEFVKVIHNGEVVHEKVSVTGPTRAAHWETEAALGPLLIQGDHGPVAIRNLRIRGISLP